MDSLEELIERASEYSWGESEDMDLVSFLEGEASDIEFDTKASMAYKLAAELISRFIEEYDA